MLIHWHISRARRRARPGSEASQRDGTRRETHVGRGKGCEIFKKTNELRMSLFRHMMCWRRLRPLRFTRPRRRALTRAAQRSQYRNVATTCCRVCPARVPHPSSVVNGSSKPRVSFALACLGDVNAYVVCVCTCAWSALLERPSEASARPSRGAGPAPRDRADAEIDCG